MARQFIKTLVPDFSTTDRIYRLGSVVEVDEGRARQLIELRHAAPAEGPEFEPDPVEPPKKPKAKADA